MTNTMPQKDQKENSREVVLPHRSNVIFMILYSKQHRKPPRVVCHFELFLFVKQARREQVNRYFELSTTSLIIIDSLNIIY